jgi:hypothetical protein
VLSPVHYIGERRPDAIDPARTELSRGLGLVAGKMLAESLACRIDDVLPTFAPCAVMHRASPEAKFDIAFFPEGMAAVQHWREAARRQDAILIRDGKATVHIGILDADPEGAWALHCVLDAVATNGKLAMSQLGVNNARAGDLSASAFIAGLDEALGKHARAADFAAGYGVLGPPKA